MGAIQINRVTNANVYVNGSSFLGRAEEINLPAVKHKVADHKALGMVGTTEFWAGIDKLECKIKWNSFYADVLKGVANPFSTLQLMARASVETYNSTGRTAETPLVVVMQVAPKDFPAGNFKQHENVELESNLTCYTLKLTLAGQDILEIDTLANIYKVNGVDMLAAYKRNIGG